MHLQHLQLREFRNYCQLDVSLPTGVVLLHGRNAQGKTNLLEAVTLLCTGRTLRAHQDAELIRWEQGAALLRAELETKARGKVEFELQLIRGEGRRLKLNRVAKRRQRDLIGIADVVTFTAADVEIIKGEPSARRKFLNEELSALSSSYDWNLTRYQRVVEQRNRLLRDLARGIGRADQLAPWDDQLVSFGSQVVARRWRLIERLNAVGVETYQQLTGGPQALTVRYHPALAAGSPPVGEVSEAVASIAEHLRAALAERRPDELVRGISLVGPHRDEVSMWIDGTDARTYASQGEQRTAALALRLNLLRVIEEELGEPPLLLLDDVLSELDAQRQTCLLQALGHAEQILLTCTQLPQLPAGMTATRWRVETGALWREENAGPNPVRPTA